MSQTRKQYTRAFKLEALQLAKTIGKPKAQIERELDLRNRMLTVGRRMAGCTRYCDGIHLDPSKGVLPRGLVLEDEGRTRGRGSVALGINPGSGDVEEQAFYLQHGNRYDAMLDFWRARRSDRHPYYVRARRFIDASGLSGPILWTELVKCQNPAGTKVVPPLNTLRTCVHLYLVKEMSAVPADWPVIAIGKEPFNIASMMFPSRTVVGIPHPTGSYGLFPRLFIKSTGALSPRINEAMSDALRADSPIATWIPVPGRTSRRLTSRVAV